MNCYRYIQKAISNFRMEQSITPPASKPALSISSPPISQNRKQPSIPITPPMSQSGESPFDITSSPAGHMKHLDRQQNTKISKSDVGSLCQIQAITLIHRLLDIVEDMEPRLPQSNTLDDEASSNSEHLAVPTTDLEVDEARLRQAEAAESIYDMDKMIVGLEHEEKERLWRLCLSKMQEMPSRIDKLKVIMVACEDWSQDRLFKEPLAEQSNRRWRRSPPWRGVYALCSG
jgi:hypothetical protein